MPLRVNEIFYSIQGESSFAGWPCVFVRLTGCNLRCTYCDTQYAYYEGSDLAVPEIVARVQAFQCSLVEVTGGEPLLQQDTPTLIARLLDLGHTVLLETNGSVDITPVDRRCIRIVDFKCPSSGAADANDFANIARLQPHDEVKCVIGDREDYEFAKVVLERIQGSRTGQAKVLLAPVFGLLEPRQLVRWILADRLPVRLNLQLHKYIWDPDQRGV